MDFYRLKSFCDDWHQKATQYNTNLLEDLFDKVITLWIIYNHLYNSSARMLAKQGNPIGSDFYNKKKPFKPPPDRMAATIGVATYYGSNKLLADLNSVNHQKDEFLSVLASGQFYLHENYKTGLPDTNRDKMLVTRATEGDVVALLELVYQARCNLFHGQKQYHSSQYPIIKGMISILEVTNRGLLKKLEEDYHHTT